MERVFYYLHYKLSHWVCMKIRDVVYEHETPHKLKPYDWVPMGLEHHVFRNEVLPHRFPIRTRIFHIMTFMRFYKGRYTKYVWQQLYLQYFSNTWLLYYAYILYLQLLCLRRWNALGRRRRK